MMISLVIVVVIAAACVIQETAADYVLYREYLENGCSSLVIKEQAYPFFECQTDSATGNGFYYYCQGLSGNDDSPSDDNIFNDFIFNDLILDDEFRAPRRVRDDDGVATSAVIKFEFKTPGCTSDDAEIFRYEVDLLPCQQTSDYSAYFCMTGDRPCKASNKEGIKYKSNCDPEKPPLIGTRKQLLRKHVNEV